MSDMPVCEFVIYRYDPPPHPEEITRLRDYMTPIECDREATQAFDRGELTPYPDLHGEILVCDSHAKSEALQKEVNQLVADGRLFDGDD